MRLSVTDIESYRLFMSEEAEWMTEERFLAGLVGPRVETPAMAVGNAFEGMLAMPEGFDEYQWRGGYRASGAEMVTARGYLPARGAWQVKLQCPYAGHIVVGKIDLLHGTHVFDVKTTGNTIDAEKYLHSYQWRFYLDLLRASVFTYVVYRVSVEADNYLRVIDVASINAFGYDGLTGDCARLVGSCVEYLTQKGLGQHPKFREA